MGANTTSGIYARADVLHFTAIYAEGFSVRLSIILSGVSVYSGACFCAAVSADDEAVMMSKNSNIAPILLHFPVRVRRKFMKTLCS